MNLLRPIESHTVAGLALIAALIWYLLAHPEVFTPETFTDDAVALLGTLGTVSAAKSYVQHKTHRPSPAPEPQPLPLSRNP